MSFRRCATRTVSVDHTSHTGTANSRGCLSSPLGGNCRTVMIVCVSPSSKDIEDTNNTLVWANRAKNVTTKVSRNTAGEQLGAAKYLEAIAEKDAMINLLRSRLAVFDEQQSELVKRKRESSRLEASGALKAIEVDIESYLNSIEDGAAERARWDAAEMRIQALESASRSTGRFNTPVSVLGMCGRGGIKKQIRSRRTGENPERSEAERATR